MGEGRIFEDITTEKKLGKETEIQVHEAQSSKQEEPIRPTLRHSVKKKKRQNLRISRWKQLAYKENPIRLSADFSGATLQAREKWQEMFKVLKYRSLKPRTL